jgi:hypothetical protein
MAADETPLADAVIRHRKNARSVGSYERTEEFSEVRVSPGPMDAGSGYGGLCANLVGGMFPGARPSSGSPPRRGTGRTPAPTAGSVIFDDGDALEDVVGLPMQHGRAP